MKITNHARERISERTGLPSRSADKLALDAKKRGLTHEAFSGSYRRYLDKLRWHNAAPMPLYVYSNHIFVFGFDGNLITCLKVPSKYLKRKSKAPKED